ncbi:Mu-like prophage major head subunit gpT family protein [bacterium]|nr:Mu-like prophage major head subunit gpT family protein [bacterium]
MAYITNEAALDAANTAFETAANAIFDGQVPGIWSQFTTLRKQTGKSAELDLVDGLPQFREWLGSRQRKNLRAYALNKPIRKWEMTIGVPVDDINGDRTGVVADRLTGFAKRAEVAYDQIMIPALVANPVGYDDVALFAATHGRGGSLADQDNITTGALNYAAYQTALVTMGNYTDYYGEPLDITPTHIICGNAQAEVAMQVSGSEKLVGLDNAGLIGGTVVTSGIMRNYHGGEVGVLVSPRIAGNRWFVADLSKGDAKPMYAAEFLAPRVDILDDPTSANVFYDDEVIYGLTTKLTPMPMAWQTIYGNPTGS